jgi:hypothetical protein
MVLWRFPRKTGLPTVALVAWLICWSINELLLDTTQINSTGLSSAAGFIEMAIALLLDPLHHAADVLDRSVLNAQFNGGSSEETAAQRLGQDFRHGRFELRQLLCVASCCAVRDHGSIHYRTNRVFSIFVFGPQMHFLART